MQNNNFQGGQAKAKRANAPLTSPWKEQTKIHMLTSCCGSVQYLKVLDY